MDPRVAAVDAKRTRVTELMVVLAVIDVGYFFVMLFVLNQFGSAMGQWAVAVFLPFVILSLTVGVLRIWTQWLRSDAALAQLEATNESFDALEAQIEQNKKDRR
jgi:hypothetical protein